MYFKIILLVVFFCILNGDALLSPSEKLEEYFKSKSKYGVLSYDSYVYYVQQNYPMFDYYNKLVNELSEDFKDGIGMATFTWAISHVDNDVPYPIGFTPEFYIEESDVLNPSERLKEYFKSKSKYGVLSYDSYVYYVQQNYPTVDYYNKLVNELSEDFKDGIGMATFTWAISKVDNAVPCPLGLTRESTAGLSQHAELLEKSKRMDEYFDGNYHGGIGKY